MKLKTNILGGLVLVIMFGGIWLTDLMGHWNTGTSKEPSLITNGEAIGKPNPADIRGSYTFNDIYKAFNIPVESLGKAFALPSGTNAGSFQVKGLETLYSEEVTGGKEIGADSVRYFVALYNNLPFTVTGDIWMPESALPVLKQRGNLTPNQVQYLETHNIKITAKSEAGAESGKTAESAPSGEIGDAKLVSGSTTFQQLLDWGVSRETIEKIIGSTMPNTGETVKSYITGKGLEFSAYKQKLQAEVHK